MIKTRDLQATTASDVLAFQARDVTGTHDLPLEVNRDLPVSAVTESIVDMWALPTNVSWGLRDDRSVYLDDTLPIGEQVETGSQLVVTPKAHLGGFCQRP